MLNNKIPHYSLTLYKTDTKNYPEYYLPEGYRFVFYKKGDEVHWAEIERSVGQFDDIESGLKSFHASFVNNQNLSLEERMIFVVSPDGEYVATSALWNGDCSSFSGCHTGDSFGLRDDIFRIHCQ